MIYMSRVSEDNTQIEIYIVAQQKDGRDMFHNMYEVFLKLKIVLFILHGIS